MTSNIVPLPVEPAGEPEQLDLGLTTADGRPLRPSRVHVRFRLDTATRRRGLRHVAEIRARLSHDESGRPEHPSGDDTVVTLPRRLPVGQRAS